MYREQLKGGVKIRAGVPYAKMRKLSFTAYIHEVTVNHVLLSFCGSFPHERQSTDVRCYATAC
jgi:hypothetical protein